MRLLSIAILGTSCAAAASAGELPEGAVKIEGKIVAEGHYLRPKSAKLTATDGKVYNVTMDIKGRSLVGVMHGQKAEILAVPSQKDGENWLQVLGYTDDRVTAAHEFWRRSRCNACVVLPATINAATPGNLHGAAEVTGRYYANRDRFAAWARDEKYLWLAADNRIVQVDLAGKKAVGSFGTAEGLPDALVYQLASDGKTLWIAHRGGLAALKIGESRVRDLAKIRAAYLRVHLDAGGAWVVADGGTFRLAAPDEEPRSLPALPTGARIAETVQKGIWIPHWGRRTGHFVTSPASIGERLFVGSYGDVYELAEGKWTKVAAGGYDQAAAGGKLWFLSSAGLNEYDPATGKTEALPAPEACRGRYSRLLAGAAAVWIAAEPAPAAGGGEPAGGGLARFDLAKRSWQAWDRIGEARADRVSCLSAEDGAVWAVTLDGKFSTKGAHPGMTTTRKSVFETTGLRLHRFDDKTGKWESWTLSFPELGQRLICGQDGEHGSDTIVPEFVEWLSVGPDRVFAATRLVPRKYFGGFWPCLDALARREGESWKGVFDHAPEQLRLQGEQPLVLNISNGELTRVGSTLKDQLWEAVAHYLVLGAFVEGGTHWAVTDGCAAWFDAGKNAWQRVVEPEYRWYWRATAALEDGGWLYLGSDRGLVCRLEVKTGRFETIGAIRDRSIARLAKGADGKIYAAGQATPLGFLPVFLAGSLKALDGEAAVWDGKALAPAKIEDLPPAGAASKWTMVLFDNKAHFDKTQGNWLCERVPGEAQPVPRWYVKEVFHPLFLCEGGEGRVWLSTYTGLVRLDLKRGQ